MLKFICLVMIAVTATARIQFLRKWEDEEDSISWEAGKEKRDSTYWDKRDFISLMDEGKREGILQRGLG